MKEKPKKKPNLKLMTKKEIDKIRIKVRISKMD
jgi:hypothetical protein